MIVKRIYICDTETTIIHKEDVAQFFRYPVFTAVLTIVCAAIDSSQWSLAL